VSLCQRAARVGIDQDEQQEYAGRFCVGGCVSRSGFCELEAVTGYRGLSGLSGGNAVRRAIVMVDPAWVAALHALILWTLRLAHTAIVGLFTCARKPTLAGHRGVPTSLWVGWADTPSESRKRRLSCDAVGDGADRAHSRSRA
jgi:hypothetical protein